MIGPELVTIKALLLDRLPRSVEVLTLPHVKIYHKKARASQESCMIGVRPVCRAFSIPNRGPSHGFAAPVVKAANGSEAALSLQ